MLCPLVVTSVGSPRLDVKGQRVVRHLPNLLAQCPVDSEVHCLTWVHLVSPFWSPGASGAALIIGYGGYPRQEVWRIFLLTPRGSVVAPTTPRPRNPTL